MNIFLDVMKEQDLYEVIKIEKEAFNNPWHIKFFRDELRYNSFALYLTAKVDKKIIGYTGCWFKNFANEVHIVNLAVRKSHRNQGIGTYLINELIEMADKLDTSSLTLEVRVSNSKAIKLYKRLGFKEEKLISNYYLDNKEDAVLMKKEISYHE